MNVVSILHVSSLPFPEQQILDSFKPKQFADYNFECNENGRKSPERIVAKGEIARYEQFLLFPMCFQKSCIANS